MNVSLFKKQINRRLVVFELTSCLPSRVYFVSEYLGAFFPSKTFLLVVEIILFEIQYIRDGRSNCNL